jgi:hypothetical protein
MQPSTLGQSRAERLGWIIDQLSLAAVAKGQVFPPERLRINAEDLIDIPQDRLALAFSRARRELDYAPGVAEIRRLASADEKSSESVEAQAAWNYVNEYLRKWGVDRMPIRSGGQWITAPPLEPRLEYAVRQIGGLWRLNQVTDENYAFMFRDFCAAYSLAPVAELMAPQILEQFGDRKLVGNVKRLADAKESERQAAGQVQETAQKPADTEVPKPVEELASERREELRRQLDEELARRGIPRSVAGLS